MTTPRGFSIRALHVVLAMATLATGVGASPSPDRPGGKLCMAGDILRIREVSDPQISPEGSRFVFKTCKC